MFKAAVSEKYVIKDIIEKVQRDALSEVENVFKGQRFKVSFQKYYFDKIIFRFIILDLL